MKLSEHFTLEEWIVSREATVHQIDNKPTNEKHIRAMVATSYVIGEKLRTACERPIVLISGYRVPALNTHLKGSSTSQHMIGQAMDIIVPGMALKDVFAKCVALPMFDQLIWEFGEWIHISYNEEMNRREILDARHGSDGKTMYLRPLPGWMPK